MKEYAAVSVDVPVLGGSRIYHYSVPQEFRENLHQGSPVLVPFGSRKARGYVLGFPSEPEVDEVRAILGLLDAPPVSQSMLGLAMDISQRYLCQVGEVLASMIPARRSALASEIWVGEKPGPGSIDRAPRQARLLEVLLRHPEGVEARVACREAGVPREVLLALERKGLARVVEEEPVQVQSPMVPTRAQTEAMAWVRGISPGTASLLFGVTGSGKTHIYIEAVKAALEHGKQAVVLVPEISLTPQTEEVFRARFGGGVALLHSRLSQGERYEEWLRVKEGKATVAVGARSAVFAPFPHLGLIILDEEHETTYKQEDSPRYHAREVAFMRARREGATVLLGSATPSVETYYRASMGTYGLFTINERPLGREMPEVHVADMREEMRAQNRSMFSKALAEKIKDTVSRGEQVILFLNRRGHSTFVLCRECGFAMRCPYCDVSLTLHTNPRTLRCHYCDYTRGIPDLCPQCGGRYLRAFGAGTQRLEEETRKAFPDARVMRMDTDTTSRKGSHGRILEAFRQHRADILVGTQMIAKGLNIDRVTLVGAVAADTALHLPDFRSPERTFQLLTQAAGRAGRGKTPGEVIIQTYNPDHYSICCAKEHDYLSFYQQEISFRQELGYPPFRELARLICSSSCEEASRRASEILAEGMEENGVLEVLGPAPAPILKIRGRYRWTLLVKASDPEQLSLGVRDALERVRGKGRPPGVRVVVDVDPTAML